MAKRGRPSAAASKDGYPKKRGPGRPRQQELIEDRAIAPLESAAADYAEVRDERMRLNEQESGLKAKLLTLMKKNGKTTYNHGGIYIEVVSEEETVKVRVKKAERELEAGDGAQDGEPGEGVSEFDDPGAGEQARH